MHRFLSRALALAATVIPPQPVTRTPAIVPPRRLTVSVEIETEAVRSHVATMLACMPDVFLVAGWAPDQLTAAPATLDAGDRRGASRM